MAKVSRGGRRQGSKRAEIRGEEIGRGSWNEGESGRAEAWGSRLKTAISSGTAVATCAHVLLHLMTAWPYYLVTKILVLIRIIKQVIISGCKLGWGNAMWSWALCLARMAYVLLPSARGWTRSPVILRSMFVTLEHSIKWGTKFQFYPLQWY